jgi:hypothetical protein
MPSASRDDLPQFDGETAFGGALRFLPADASPWAQRWLPAFAELRPRLDFFATDAFCTLFGRNSDENVVIFLPETGELDALDVKENQFLALILEDPHATIHLDLFEQAVKKFGRLAPDETFALRIETALGGALEIANVYKTEQTSYLIALGKIARQIQGMDVGDRITSVERDADTAASD